MLSIDFLKKIEILNDLDDSQLSEIQMCWNEKEYKQGDKIFAEGEDAAHMWVVSDGRVGLRFDLPGRTTSQENTVSTNTTGMTIGWSSFVAPYTYSLSAYCDSDTCKLVQVEKDCLDRISQKNAKIGYIVMSNIAKVIGKRFHQLQEEVIKRTGYEVMFNW